MRAYIALCVRVEFMILYMAFHFAHAFLFLVALHCFCFACTSSLSTNAHIVYMGAKKHDDEAAEAVQKSHHHLLTTIFQSKEEASSSILYNYKHGFSGFAALLSSSQAKLIADLPGVIRVIPNRIYKLHTTRSWDYLQVDPQLINGILLKGQAGSGSIIGLLDSGIWPESESFKWDGMERVPLHWRGTCQEGQAFDHSHCNGKIIGARWYIKGYMAEFGELDTKDGTEFLSPRDAEGHGTHTSSIAAGIHVQNVSFLGLGHGMARGGAPSARLAVYKVCWATGGCSSADILAALDDAIHDGVDVISMSLGSLPPLATYADDAVSIGSFHAVSSGISVVCSGGNSGPFPESIGNTAPWMITVAASTIDRYFPTVITIGNNQTLVGQSLFVGVDLNNFYPIVYGEDITADNADENDARSCTSGSLNATLAKGKVLLCFETRTQKYATVAAKSVKEVEGVGVVFAKYPTKEVNLCMDVPCVQVDITVGTSLLSYIASTSNPVVKFNVPRTEVGHQVSPNVALFSSRGPSSLSPTVLKPDIAAPGVNILAAWSAATTAQPSGGFQEELNYPFKFKFASGTSMACPHVSAIVSLLKSIHPEWSPAAIKSALITTAYSTGKYGYAIAEAAPTKQADPFDYGGGHVDPNRAIDPGLVYDADVQDHVHFLCALGYNTTAIASLTKTSVVCTKSKSFLESYNLPSIVIPQLRKRFTVSRIVTNVGPDFSIYTSRIEAPPGTDVVVEPPILVFSKGVKKIEFKAMFCSRIEAMGSYSFGNLIWEDGFHVVKIPLAVKFVV